MASSDAIADCN